MTRHFQVLFQQRLPEFTERKLHQQYADLAYYSFPIIIDGQPRGMINGRMKEDDWTFGFRVLTELQSRVHQLKTESKNPHLFDSFYLNIDTTGIFAIITESGQAYIIPANHHSANMINVRKQKHGGYDPISFSSAYDLLIREVDQNEHIKKENE